MTAVIPSRFVEKAREVLARYCHCHLTPEGFDPDCPRSDSVIRALFDADREGEARGRTDERGDIVARLREHGLDHAANLAATLAPRKEGEK